MPNDRSAGRLLVQNPILRSNYHRVFHEIAEREDLNAGAKLAHAVLVSYTARYREVFPGQVRLARDIGATVRTVIRYMQELEAVGLLQVERRRGGLTNVYTLLDWTAGHDLKEDDNLSLTNDKSSLTEGKVSHQTVEAVTHSLRKKKKEEGESEQRIDNPAERIWNEALLELRASMSQANFTSHFTGTRGVRFTGSQLTVSVSNPLIRDALEKRFTSHTQRALYDVVGHACTVEFIST